MPQTGCLKPMEIYSLEFLEARSPKPRHWQAALALKSVGEDPSLLLSALVTPGVPWLVAASFQSPPLASRGRLPVCFWCNVLLTKERVILD